MYENNNQRARFGDPLLVSPEWQGLPSNLDAFLHYWEYSYASRAFTDEYYFFKGSLTVNTRLYDVPIAFCRFIFRSMDMP